MEENALPNFAFKRYNFDYIFRGNYSPSQLEKHCQKSLALVYKYKLHYIIYYTTFLVLLLRGGRCKARTV